MKKSVVQKAVDVLRNLKNKQLEDDTKTKPLLEDDSKSIFLQIMLKKVPKMKTIKMIKVNLPHSLIKETNEVCLITGDLDKKNRKAEVEPDVLHYKDLLSKHGISEINEVMTLRQLRTEYKPFEAKQKLLAAYDIFLSDNRIHGCLPQVLGRHFIKKRKFPIQINMTTVNLKAQVDKALSTKVVYFTGHGNSCTSEVAYLDMEDAEIFENVESMVKVLKEQLPGSWDNVMGVYLRTALSKAIPLYISYDNPNDIHLEDDKDETDFEMDELSSVPDGLKIKVFSDGTVKVISNKDDLPVLEDEVEDSETFDKLVTEIRRSKRQRTEIPEISLTNNGSMNASKIIKRQKIATSNNSDMEEAVAKFTEDSDDLELNEASKKSKKGKRKIQTENVKYPNVEEPVTSLTEESDDLELNEASKKSKKGKRKIQTENVKYPNVEEPVTSLTEESDDLELNEASKKSKKGKRKIQTKNVKDSNVEEPATSLTEDSDVLELKNEESKKSKKETRKRQAKNVKYSNVEEPVVPFIEDSDVLELANGESKKSKKGKAKRQTKNVKDSNVEEPVMTFIEDSDVLEFPNEESKILKKGKRKIQAKSVKDTNVEQPVNRFIDGKRRTLRSTRSQMNLV